EQDAGLVVGVLAAEVVEGASALVEQQQLGFEQARDRSGAAVLAKASDQPLEHRGAELGLADGEQPGGGLLEGVDGLETLGGVVEQADLEEHEVAVDDLELVDARGEVEAGLVERVGVAPAYGLADRLVRERDMT